MVDLDFDLRAFSWVIMHTDSYNRLASRMKVEKKDDYFFPGPILRRMTAEQVWDSLVTLMVKDPLRFRQPSAISLSDVSDGISAFYFLDNMRDNKYRLVDSQTGEIVMTEGQNYVSVNDQNLLANKGKKDSFLPVLPNCHNLLQQDISCKSLDNQKDFLLLELPRKSVQFPN